MFLAVKLLIMIGNKPYKSSFVFIFSYFLSIVNIDEMKPYRMRKSTFVCNNSFISTSPTSVTINLQLRPFFSWNIVMWIVQLPNLSGMTASWEVIVLLHIFFPNR